MVTIGEVYAQNSRLTSQASVATCGLQIPGNAIVHSFADSWLQATYASDESIRSWRLGLYGRML